MTLPPPDPIAPTMAAPSIPPRPSMPPQPTPVGPAGWVAPPPRPPKTPWLIGAAGVGIGFGLGVLVGLLASGDSSAPASETASATSGEIPGELAVGSEPSGGVVLVDGRVVGLTPIPRLELRPGDHSIAIDLFGYQPYLGTLTIESGARAGLDAYLAALGATGGGATRGDFRGGGKVVARPIPRSALVGAAAAPAEPAPAPASKKHRRARSPRPEPPARDCGREERDCKYDCGRAQTRCDFDCPGCSSCLTSDGWDKCKQMCSSCRQGCKSNLTFCESRCESARRQCR